MSGIRALRSAVDLRRDPRTMVALGDREVVAGLQVHLELGADAEMVGEAQRGVRADRALAVEDRRDPPRGDAQRQGQPVGRHAACRQLALQDATRVNRDHRSSSLVVVDDLDVMGVTARETKADAPGPVPPRTAFGSRCPRPDHAQRSTLKLAGSGLSRCLRKRPCRPATAGSAVRRAMPSLCSDRGAGQGRAQRAGSAGRRSLTGAGIGAGDV